MTRVVRLGLAGAMLAMLAWPLVVQGRFNYVTNADTTITITGYTGEGGDVTIPGTTNGRTVVSIGTNAFLKCTSLTTITIPGSITNIGKLAFHGCTNLTGVCFNGNPPRFWGFVFAKDSKAKIYCLQGATNWLSTYGGLPLVTYQIQNGQSTITGHRGVLDTVIIPSMLGGGTVTSIGTCAFYKCPFLTSVMIPESVTSIGYYAFGDSKSLNSVAIPNRVTSIGKRAFYGCSSLASLSVPASVNTIGVEAFKYCTSLTSVYFQGNAPILGEQAFAENELATIYYLPGTSGWDETCGGRPTALWEPEAKKHVPPMAR